VLYKLSALCGRLVDVGWKLADELGIRFFAHAHTGDELRHI